MTRGEAWWACMAAASFNGGRRRRRSSAELCVEVERVKGETREREEWAEEEMGWVDQFIGQSKG